MLFNSLAYIIFLPVVVALFWLSPRYLRTAILLVASYVFYMSWKPVYGLLIFGLTVVNYFFGLAIHRWQPHKKALMTLAVVINLLTLGYFKYTYYAIDLANQALAPFKSSLGPLPFEIILPLGISFFVFEFIHYTVDVYRGGKPIRNFIDFACFASFFPTQLAGPIKRYQDFVPQLKLKTRFTLKNFDEGMWLILFGLFKKVVFADNLAAVVQSGYSHPELLTGVDTWLVVYAFAFQVYFDFSGYTDVARGSAQLLGYKVPINFNLPYLSSSIAEHWHRWHITLSTWLRDYLYIPLGGSRCSRWFNYRNLFLTMLLGGIWHGAGTHFVVWGAYQGLALVAHKIFKEFADARQWLVDLRNTTGFRLFAIFLTFQTTCVGYVLFRAETMDIAVKMFKKMFFIGQVQQSVPGWAMTIVNINEPSVFMGLPLILALLVGAQIVCGLLNARKNPIVWPVPARALAVTGLIAALLVFSPDTSPQFVYFQF